MEEKDAAYFQLLDNLYKKANIFIKSDYYLMNLAMLKVYSRYGTNIKRDEKKDYLFWKDGLIIEKGKEMLLIKFNRKEQRIELFPTVNKNNFNLQQQVVDYILDIPIKSKHARLLGLEETGDINISSMKLLGGSKYFDVYVGDSSGYFIPWKKLAKDAQSGLKNRLDI
jgi:hypothetical protein